MNKIDPQKKANEIMAALKRRAKQDGYKYWQLVGDFGLCLEKSIETPDIIDPVKSVTADSERPKVMTKRQRADLMKVSAILQDAAAQHKALEKCQEQVPSDAVSRLVNSLVSD